MARAMAHSPAALEGFLALAAALGGGVLPAATQERTALAVSEANGCSYCLSAHTHVAREVAGLPQEEIFAARRGTSADPKEAALLRLAVAVLRSRGRVGEEGIEEARRAGITDPEIVEVIANVARNILTNYLNEALAVDIDIEWPPVTPEEGGERHSAAA
ncbi:uncharacterized peroxidase-related enzyme [Streptomyces aidingensis]|uniref:Uncharacterized peroxidase-related enzyme n=2 Tax=Streptomyces aidingensis TaxID=910347 RepID=A0A1I1QZY2_9ACTN|nr:uncharacterized peroxidase-related enzyme [Streptomyces aidingensis]